MARQLLGGRGFLVGGPVRVYRTPDALEVDETEDHQLTRKRLYWDDVLLVTLHSRRDWLFFLFAVSFSGLGALVSIAVGTESVRGAVGIAVFSWLPLLGYGFARLLVGIPTVSVFGRRSMTRLEFPVRPRRAREVFNELARTARRRQEALTRSRLAAERPRAQGS